MAKKKADVAAWQELGEEIHRTGVLAKPGTPLRSAHEVLLCGSYVHRGLFANALEVASQTHSPDVSTYVALQLLQQLPRGGGKDEPK